MHRDTDMADIWPRDLPGQRETVGKAVGHPIGGKFGRQEQVQIAGLVAKRAELDGFDPLVEKLLPEVLAQALANIGPVRGKIYGLMIFTHQLGAPFQFEGAIKPRSPPTSGNSSHRLLLPIRAATRLSRERNGAHGIPFTRSPEGRASNWELYLRRLAVFVPGKCVLGADCGEGQGTDCKKNEIYRLDTLQAAEMRRADFNPMN